MHRLDRMFGLHAGVRCRGIALSASRAYVKERFGAVGWQELLTALPDEKVAAVWDALILPAGWYALPLYDDFLDAMQRCFGETTPVGEELGRRVARAEIHHRIFLAGHGDPRRVLEESPLLWSSYFSDGAVCVMKSSSDTVELVLHNPGVHPMVCSQVIVGWGSEIVEAAGFSVVENVHHRCARAGSSTCAYRVRWR